MAPRKRHRTKHKAKRAMAKITPTFDPFTIDDLSVELLRLIFIHIGPEEIGFVYLVNKRWRTILCNMNINELNFDRDLVDIFASNKLSTQQMLTIHCYYFKQPTHPKKCQLQCIRMVMGYQRTGYFNTGLIEWFSCHYIGSIPLNDYGSMLMGEVLKCMPQVYLPRVLNDLIDREMKTANIASLVIIQRFTSVPVMMQIITESPIFHVMRDQIRRRTQCAPKYRNLLKYLGATYGLTMD